MGYKIPAASAGQLVLVDLPYFPQITADVTDAAVKIKCPVKGKVVGVLARARAIGGSTPMTDTAVEVLKNAVALCSPSVPVVAGSAIVAGGTYGTLSTVAGALDVVVDDVLAIKLIDVTGGSSPTLDGLVVQIAIVTK